MPASNSGAALGTSDPVSYTCSCEEVQSSSPHSPSGSVLLFYRYWAASPVLPSSLSGLTTDLEDLAAWYSNQTSALGLSGKIRIAREGFNVTVGGTNAQISKFISNCVGHWSFAGLGLGTADSADQGELEAQKQFFKPTPGCACVFSGRINVRVVAEATPLAVEGYAPKDWSTVVALSPADFHAKCHDEARESFLVDVRNHYESRIGYFESPLTGEPALRPPIRRFSQWPQYVKAHVDDLKRTTKGKQILTYCTGGIRCEKGVRWMQEYMGEGDTVFTLKGGIAAYLDWMDAEIREGKKTPEESLFKGRNYVFDARGALGLAEGETLVSRCLVCDKPSARLDKCRSEKCHLVLVICENCQTSDPRCCSDCRQIDSAELAPEGIFKKARLICACERAREDSLWTGKREKTRSRAKTARGT